jgi:hypothetical protein
MHTGDVPFEDRVDLTVLPTHLANCLRDVKARTIEIEGSHIAFTGGMFRVVSNWNVLVPFGYGDLTVDAITRQVHYRLSSRQLVVSATVLSIVLAIFVVVQVTASSGGPWQPILAIPLIWVWLVGGNLAIGLWRFQRFLRNAVSTAPRQTGANALSWR